VSVDFEREGLLQGAEKGEAREARTKLLQELLDDDVPLEELKRAVAESRLAVLPAERTLTGEQLYTAAEVAERSGVSEDFLLAQQQALGMPRRDPAERVFTDEDLESATQAGRFRDAGLPEDGQLEVARVIGHAMETVAAATRDLVGPALLEAGATEHEVARRYAAAAAELGPLMGTILQHQYRVRLREGLRRDAAVPPSALASGELPGGREIAVGFADLVGFTRLGERMPAGDLGRLSGRLGRMADDLAEEPVRLIKTIGDAVMLVSTEAAPLVGMMLDLLDASETAEEDFPQLRAGAAFGTALARGGDWYGHPVNLASRVTDAARPGSLLVAGELREAVEGELGAEGDDEEAAEGKGPYRWSRASGRRFKGVEGRVELYRVRRRSGGD
jgi:adenylate cyclase